MWINLLYVLALYNLQWWQVEAAMKQLAGNPLFRQNPACLGAFLEKLATDAATKTVSEAGSAASEHGSAVKSHVEDPESPQEAPSESYKSYWSRFKRKPSVPTLDIESQESVQPVHMTPPVDNQLGDPSLYPPTPVSPQAAETQLDLTPGKVETAEVMEDEPGKPGEKKSSETPEVLEDASKRSSRPQPEDVRAALHRKSTVDLMVKPAENLVVPASPGMTQVLMTLAGQVQPVWVPMSLEEARAAGLKPVADQGAATAASVAATPQTVVQNTPVDSQAPAATPVPDTSEPTTALQDKNNANKQELEDVALKKTPAEQAQAALKNGYMRFHRSVTSNFDAINYV